MRHALLTLAVIIMVAVVSLRAGGELTPAIDTPGGSSPIAEDLPPGSRQAVIPPGQEDMLVDMLGKGAELPGPCKLSGAEAKQTMIRAEYACPSGAIAAEFYHPDDAPAGATKTSQFAIVVPAAAPSGFGEALVERVRAREAPFQWKYVGRSAVAAERKSPIVWFAVAAVVAVIVIVRIVRRRRASP
jgi:hypothetical protein